MVRSRATMVRRGNGPWRRVRRSRYRKRKSTNVRSYLKAARQAARSTGSSRKRILADAGFLNVVSNGVTYDVDNAAVTMWQDWSSDANGNVYQTLTFKPSDIGGSLYSPMFVNNFASGGGTAPAGSASIGLGRFYDYWKLRWVKVEWYADGAGVAAESVIQQYWLFDGNDSDIPTTTETIRRSSNVKSKRVQTADAVESIDLRRLRGKMVFKPNLRGDLGAESSAVDMIPGHTRWFRVSDASTGSADPEYFSFKFVSAGHVVSTVCYRYKVTYGLSFKRRTNEYYYKPAE